MAVTKILARKGGLNDAIRYVVNGDKTNAYLNCDPGHAARQMRDTKESVNKTDGVQYYQRKLGLGQAVMGWILAGVGFYKTLPAQAPAALAGISFVYNGIPVICVSLRFVLMLFHRLDEEMPAIRAELDKRKDA